MAILPIYYTTTNLRKRKSHKPTKAMIESRRMTEELLKKVGYTKPTKTHKKFTYSLAVESNAAPMSNTIPGGAAAKRDKLTDHKWKRGAEESAATVKAIEEKAMRTAPAFSKGAYQYITDMSDPSDLGKKK